MSNLIPNKGESYSDYKKRAQASGKSPLSLQEYEEFMAGLEYEETLRSEAGSSPTFFEQYQWPILIGGAILLFVVMRRK